MSEALENEKGVGRRLVEENGRLRREVATAKVYLEQAAEVLTNERRRGDKEAELLMEALVRAESAEREVLQVRVGGDGSGRAEKAEREVEDLRRQLETERELRMLPRPAAHGEVEEADIRKLETGKLQDALDRVEQSERELEETWREREAAQAAVVAAQAALRAEKEQRQALEKIVRVLQAEVARGGEGGVSDAEEAQQGRHRAGGRPRGLMEEEGAFFA